MKAADMHCDTISEIYNHRKNGKACFLKKNELHLDLEKMKQGDYILQNFAAFVNLGKEKKPFEYCMELIDCFYGEILQNNDSISMVKSYGDIVKNMECGKISAMLTIEEGGVCQGKLSFLRDFYRIGVRMLTLTWNYENELGSPNYYRDKEGIGYAVVEEEHGLTETGINFIREMEEIGMIIDVSHLSDKGFWDVIQYTKVPFAASHSNARAICSHPRNLSDDMIKALGNRGGVMGLNYFFEFLRDVKDKEVEISMIEDMVIHTKHIINVGGINCLGLGSDFDGIYGKLEIADGSRMSLLADRLIKSGLHESDVEAIFNKNVLRLYKELLK